MVLAQSIFAPSNTGSLPLAFLRGRGFSHPVIDYLPCLKRKSMRPTWWIGMGRPCCCHHLCLRNSCQPIATVCVAATKSRVPALRLPLGFQAFAGMFMYLRAPSTMKTEPGEPFFGGMTKLRTLDARLWTILPPPQLTPQYIKERTILRFDQ